MRTLTAILFAVLLMAGTFPAAAQHQHGKQKAGELAQGGTQSQGGMMQGDMMGSMHQMHMQMMGQVMKNPFKHAAMMVQMLPTMKNPLGLSDEQVAHFEEEAEQFNRQQAALKDKASQAEAQLKDMLASDKPDPATVRSLLRETAMHRADIKALGLEIADRMKAELTAEQRVKLADMTPMQMHHHMATHMTMMEMMHTMHGNMMPGGMMEMMQTDNMQGKMMRQ